MPKAPLHLFSQHNEIEVQQWHWCWNHMMTIVPKWHHYIPYVKPIGMRCKMTFFHLMPLTSTLASHDATGIHFSVM